MVAIQSPSGDKSRPTDFELTPAMKAAEKAAQAEEDTDTADQDWRWADPKTLKVNPAFQSLIPLQAKGEYQALEVAKKASEESGSS
jgi:hypothetical protein